MSNALIKLSLMSTSLTSTRLPYRIPPTRCIISQINYGSVSFSKVIEEGWRVIRIVYHFFIYSNFWPIMSSVGTISFFMFDGCFCVWDVGYWKCVDCCEWFSYEHAKFHFLREFDWSDLHYRVQLYFYPVTGIIKQIIIIKYALNK